MAVVEALEGFLRSSSIAGLSHIANERSFSKVFWIFTIVMCFLISGFYIDMAFQSWAESPVKTLIETMPSSQLVFPKVYDSYNLICKNIS